MSITQQADNRGNLDGFGGGVDLVMIGFFGLGHTLQHKDEGTANRGDVNWLEGGVQNQHRSLHYGRPGRLWRDGRSYDSGIMRTRPQPNIGPGT